MKYSGSHVTVHTRPNLVARERNLSSRGAELAISWILGAWPLSIPDVATREGTGDGTLLNVGRLTLDLWHWLGYRVGDSQKGEESESEGGLHGDCDRSSKK